MKIETVVAALNYDFNTLEKQNFKGDVLIVNQSTENKSYNLQDNVRVIEISTRGIGENRFTGLKNATGDIIVLADDDETFDDNYHDTIKNAYLENPKADVIMFNVRRSGDSRREIFSVDKSTKLHYLNSLKFGAVNITFKRESILNKNISFDRHFGKRPFIMGEDSIFIYDALKSNLKLYYVNKDIGSVDLSDSSWFKGYNQEYFIAKGAQFYRLSRTFSLLLMLQFVIRKRKLFVHETSLTNAMKYMIEGKNEYLNLASK